MDEVGNPLFPTVCVQLERIHGRKEEPHLNRLGEKGTDAFIFLQKDPVEHPEFRPRPSASAVSRDALDEVGNGLLSAFGGDGRAGVHH